MRIMKLAVIMIAGASLVLTGCAKKIDGSSPEAFHASVEKIQTGLSDEKRQRFSAAMTVVAMSNLDMSAVFAGKATADSFQQKTMTELNGLSANDVIARAKTIADQRDATEKEQAKSEIKDLLAKRDAAESAKAGLAQFQVLKSRFDMKGGYLSTDPEIMMTVRNGTGKAVSRAYFHAVLASPGRSVPWKEADFNYQISGGIEPGEQKDWTLDPSFEWHNVEAPADAILTVKTIRLDGADGNAFLDAAQFGDDEAKRLAVLQTKFGG